MQQTWLTAHSQTLFSKLRVIEKQLLVQTYTNDTMPALRKLDDHLAKAHRKLDARDAQVTLGHVDLIHVSIAVPIDF